MEIGPIRVLCIGGSGPCPAPRACGEGRLRQIYGGTYPVVDTKLRSTKRRRRNYGREAMKRVIYALLAGAGVLATPCAAPAQDAKATIPQFQVDALWPKPLPNNWIVGQVAGITVYRLDRLLCCNSKNLLDS